MIVESTQPDPPHNWRRLGTRFAVQQVYVRFDGKSAFRVESTSGNPALIDAEHFKLVDGTIPANWVASEPVNSGTVVFGPAAWSGPGFWERWMDDGQAELEAYQEFRSTIEDHEGQ